MIDLFASEQQYLDHLLPIWNLIPNQYRGTAFIPARIGWMEDRIRGPVVVSRKPPKQGGKVLVASFQDYRDTKGRSPILLEHGAGQTYGDGHPSNAGGSERDHVSLFLCPNSDVMDRNRTAYPRIPSVVVGVPKLDLIPAAPSNDRPTVALSFHWDNRQCPESRWAFPHYQPAIVPLLEHYNLLGHGHPRWRRAFEKIWASLGIEHVPEFSEVMRRADLYVCDNSSTLYEFAAAGRPVVVLNAPWYRRDARHGLRFWDQIPGLMIDEPQDLIGAIVTALDDPPYLRSLREKVVRRVYPVLDGRAAERAVQAIEDHLGWE